MFANRVEGEKYTASIHAGFSAHEERERIKRMQRNVSMSLGHLPLAFSVVPRLSES